MPDQFKISLSDSETVSGLVYLAAKSNRNAVSLILGHGAGAPQTSGFMVRFASELAERGIDTITFNFSYMERGRRVPDPGPKLESCYRSVIRTVRARPGLELNKLIIGGKSMGGRIASQTAAHGERENIDGLVFLGYPLHPPGKPEQLRDKHLPDIKSPMLFVQGSKDTFGTAEELRPILARIKVPTELYIIEGGDHSFKVPKKAGKSQDDVYSEVLDKIRDWVLSN
jgi:predicted alpha/beta-hydrolase family hydrolase